jgi:hypothetical protein
MVGAFPFGRRRARLTATVLTMRSNPARSVLVDDGGGWRVKLGKAGLISGKTVETRSRRRHAVLAHHTGVVRQPFQ